MPRALRLWLLVLQPMLASESARAQVLIGVGTGISLSSTLRSGNRFPANQQSYGLFAEYQHSMRKPLIKIGPETLSLGLGMHAGSIRYRVDQATNTGGNLAVSLRVGWKTELEGGQWLLGIAPEFVLFSYMSAASFTESEVSGNEFQSASLSSFSGSGSLGFSISLYHKIPINLRNVGLIGGGSLGYLNQNFTKKVDTVQSTTPSTGEPVELSRTTTGSFGLSSLYLQLQLGFIFD